MFETASTSLGLMDPPPLPSSPIAEPLNVDLGGERSPPVRPALTHQRQTRPPSLSRFKRNRRFFCSSTRRRTLSSPRRLVSSSLPSANGVRGEATLKKVFPVGKAKIRRATIRFPMNDASLLSRKHLLISPPSPLPSLSKMDTKQPFLWPARARLRGAGTGHECTRPARRG